MIDEVHGDYQWHKDKLIMCKITNKEINDSEVYLIRLLPDWL